MTELWSDIRQAARALARTPYVMLVSVLSIGLGVGAATAVFSWMDGLVLHPFPATTDQTRLVGIEVGPPNGGMGAWSYSTFKELRDGAKTFSGMAAWRIVRVSVRQPGEPFSTPLLATTVSGRYFDVLGVRPALGRTIVDADVDAIAPVAVISYQYWIDQFQQSPSALGKPLLLNGEAVTIIGVAPPNFSGVYTGVVPHMYVPLTISPRLTGVNTLEDRKLRSWLLFARLKPGATIEAARDDADAVAKRITASYGDLPAPGAVVTDLRVEFLGATLSPLFRAMLAVTVLLVLLASANVASLLLVRAGARRHEIAVRLAIGASRWRVARTLLVESALLALAGSVVGIGVTYASRGALYYFVPQGAYPISLPIPISWRVLGLALTAAAAVTMACGLMPAISGVRVAPQSALRGGSRTIAAGSSRLRSAIVAGQLALCVVFLAFAGMFARGLQSAAAVDVGFSDPSHVLLVDTDLRPARLSDTAGTVAVAQLLERLRALPDVKSASVASMVPLGFGGRRIVEMKVEGHAAAPNEDMTAERAQVGSDYARTMQITIVKGRDILADDRAESTPVVMVNEAFVKRFLDGANSIGRRVDAGRGPATIVGVVHDGKYDRLDEPAHPVVYVPIAQWFVPSMTVHVRTAGNPLALVAQVRQALLGVNVDVPALVPRTLAQHISASTFVPRTGATVVSTFAMAALLLSAVGLYGALAFAVALRTRELAIRMSLGAARSSVAWLVARHALTISGIGILVGGALAVVGGRILQSQIVSVKPGDPIIFGAAVLALAVTAAAAALVPAARATRLNPAAVLRGD